MVYKCCVPKCRGNYNGERKVHMFSFPSDSERRKKWINKIPRKNFVPTKHSRVCSSHFNPGDIETDVSYFDEKTGKLLVVPLEKPRLHSDAIPSVFPDCPSYLSSTLSTREAPEVKRQKLEAAAVEKATEESIKSKQEYDEAHSFSNFEEFIKCIKHIHTSDFWDTVVKDKYVIFLNLDAAEVPKCEYCIVVGYNLMISLTFRGQTVKNFGDKYNFPFSVRNVSDVSALLHSVEETKKKPETCDISCILSMIQHLLKILKARIENHASEAVKFISAQLDLCVNTIKRIRYDPDTLIFSSLLYCISPHAYKFIRHSGNILLPHPNTLKKVCSSHVINPCFQQFDDDFLCYAKHRVTTLEPQEKYVSLLLDEIHIKQYLDYKGGNIVGIAFDSSEMATSVHVFMLQGVFSSLKEVVHILPVKTLAADKLHYVLQSVIIGLEKIGFKVICVVTDNNSVNRKAMSHFASVNKFSFVYPHPMDPSRPLFYLIDSVHLLKCIRNNWVNQRNADHCMFFPEFSDDSKEVQVASFSALRKLHGSEIGKVLKHGYGLTLKALWPSSIDKQNVKLALKVFSSHVANALLERGTNENLPHYHGTAKFLQIIIQWWSIMNVKTPNKGKRLRDLFQEPLTNSPDDEKVIFLNKFLIWLNKWNEQKCNTGFLSRETHAALTVTTQGLLELAEYCSAEIGMDYLLPGKFQTDALEARFGKYRQLAGSQYHISLRQVFEAEKKLRIPSFLDTCPLKPDFGYPTHEDTENECPEQKASVNPLLYISVDPEEITELDEDNVLPVIVYIAGYCAYVCLKKLKCDFCKENLVLDKQFSSSLCNRLIKNLDRGALMYPQETVVTIVAYNYVVLQKLTESHLLQIFLQSKSQKNVLMEVTSNILSGQEELCVWVNCPNGHSFDDVLKIILSASSNTLLKNYCTDRNDVWLSNKTATRKLKKCEKTH